MSVYMIISGIIIIGISFAMGAMALLGMLPMEIYLIVSMACGIIGGFVILFVAFMANGVLGPFISSKLRGHTLLANITASNNIQLLSGPEREGLIETRVGQFFAVPGAVYSWPNGIRGGISFFKYGVTLPKKLIQATTALRKAGIEDYKQMSETAEDLKEKGQELVVRTD